MNNNDALVDEAIRNKWKTCLYGLGKYGKSVGRSVFESLGLELNYVSDRDEDVLCKSEYENVNRLSLNELLMIEEDCFVVVCVAMRYQDQIRDIFGHNTKIHYSFIHDIIKMDRVVNGYYGIHAKRLGGEKKIAVFTCITGGYDEILEPKVMSSSCDYYIISDIEKSNSNYQFIPVNNVVQRSIDNPKEQNRYCKMHGYEIFSGYDISIYLDGSIEIVGDISEYATQIGFSGLAMLRHPLRKCIYEEGIIAASSQKADKEKTVELMRQYANAGMPREYGLFECGIVVCDHSNSMGRTILDNWYEEYARTCLRDQYALPYVLWKMDLPCSVIGLVDGGRDVRRSEVAIKHECHHKCVLY